MFRRLAEDGAFNQLAKQAQPVGPVSLGPKKQQRAVGLGLKARIDVELQSEVGRGPGDDPVGRISGKHCGPCGSRAAGGGVGGAGPVR